MNEYEVIVAAISPEFDSRWTTQKICAYKYETDAGGSLHFYNPSLVKIRSFSEGSWVDVTLVGALKEEIGE